MYLRKFLHQYGTERLTQFLKCLSLFYAKKNSLSEPHPLLPFHSTNVIKYLVCENENSVKDRYCSCPHRIFNLVGRMTKKNLEMIVIITKERNRVLR